MKKYNNNVLQSDASKGRNDSKQLSKSITIMYAGFALVLTLLLGISVGKMISNSNTNTVVDETNVDAVFTEIINDKPYEFQVGEGFGFACSEENKSKNIKIEYILSDVTSNTAMFSTIVEAGDVCDFIPSDYFTGTHVISVTQNAYSTNDLVGSDVLASRTTEIIITVIQPESVNTLESETNVDSDDVQNDTSENSEANNNDTSFEDIENNENDDVIENEN